MILNVAKNRHKDTLNEMSPQFILVRFTKSVVKPKTAPS